ncbi:MAG: EF-hand domain-containing protein [Syntrophobacterales bacterium]|nr:EF-hand domain-containing protein [Syntrophobacterales bacterium]
MRNICIIALISLWAFVAAVQGICEDNRQTITGKGDPDAVAGNKRRQERTAKSRDGGFAGMVMGVNQAGKTISVKGKSRTVTFDVSNSAIKGGWKPEDFKVGSYVIVSYTADGIAIRRTSKKDAKSEGARETSVRAGRGGQTRERVKAKGTSFQDMDENKDGKITPVELSVAIGGLTMKQFREYDKNVDGYLSESEYRAIPR